MSRQEFRKKVRTVIFGHDTPAGKAFDVILIMSILVSVGIVMLDSVHEYNVRYGTALHGIEWFFTIVFTIEYVLRLYSSTSKRAYARSFFGVVDLIAILPTYLALVLPGSQYFMVVRVLRVLRLFRILKFTRYISESRVLVQSLKDSRRKIAVFLLAVFTITIIIGSMMFIIEGEENGFTSIPRSVYWAIVTLTTVGYGDISPQTPLGQALSILIMITGYGIIAVPTGIVSAEMTRKKIGKEKLRSCSTCHGDEHDSDAAFCKHCGGKLEKKTA